MSAYAVFTRERTLDQTELEIYWSKVESTFANYKVKIHAAYGPHEVLEGMQIEGAVIAEFPSLAEAKEWYHSPAYQEAARHRHNGAIYHAYIIEGLS
jgi:uncharacterized protein (DUF1330 family)